MPCIKMYNEKVPLLELQPFRLCVDVLADNGDCVALNPSGLQNTVLMSKEDFEKSFHQPDVFNGRWLSLEPVSSSITPHSGEHDSHVVSLPEARFEEWRYLYPTHRDALKSLLIPEKYYQQKTSETEMDAADARIMQR